MEKGLAVKIDGWSRAATKKDRTLLSEGESYLVCGVYAVVKSIFIKMKRLELLHLILSSCVFSFFKSRS